MNNTSPYIKLCCYDDRCDPLPPNNYRPELVIGDYILMLDFRGQKHNGCMDKASAESIVRDIGSSLDIEIRGLG